MATTLMQAFLDAGYKPVKPRKARERKVQKCFKCGGDMRFVEDTNIMVCTGDVEIKDKETGTIKLIPCGNTFIFSNFK